MAGLVPAIHVLWHGKEAADGRDIPGHDGGKTAARNSLSSALEHVEMKAAVDRRAVACGKVTGLLGLVAPTLEHGGMDATGQQARFSCGAENDARSRPRRTGNFLPQRIELDIAHPVLRIEQHIAVQ